jgi:TonB family protein
LSAIGLSGLAAAALVSLGASELPATAAMEFYPAKARASAVAGGAVLKCGLSEHIRLVDCVLLGESPRGFGFGEAALALAQRSVDNPDVPPKAHPDGQVIVFKFSLTPPSIEPNTLVPTHLATGPIYRRVPTADEVASVTPAAARRAHMPGVAVLDCVVTLEGKASPCQVRGEAPKGWGFGDAALRLTRYIQFDPKMVDGEPQGDGHATIPVRFLTR